MREINCNIINDLMPLYVDDVLSKDSKEMLEEHISGCQSCKETLEKMRSDVPIVEEKDVKPLKKIRKKLLARSVIIMILLIALAAVYIACEVIWIPVTYVGEDLMNDMEVVFMEDGAYIRREELSARGDIIIVDNREGVLKFYIGENVPDHFRMAWYSHTCYTKLMDYQFPLKEEGVKEIDYCDKDGKVLYVLWQREKQME